MRQLKKMLIPMLTIMGFGYLLFRSMQVTSAVAVIIVISLLGGVLFESLRLATNWRQVIFKIFITLLLSLAIFLPGQHEHVNNFQQDLMHWPYFFIFIFLCVSIFIHQQQVTQKLTEGITLVQSLSVLYWMFDLGFLKVQHPLIYLLIGLSLCFVLFSFVHAFSNLKITKRSRLFLSIWSSVIMLIFAFENIFWLILKSQNLEFQVQSLGVSSLQFFLLGVSAVYIMQNAWMLFSYLPSRGTSFQSIRELNQMHVTRYSSRQVEILESGIVFLFTSILYCLNFKYQFFPRITMIWLVFVLYPYAILCKNFILSHANTK